MITVDYMAGFFDGEGSIGVYKGHQRNCYFLRTQLTQNVSDSSRHLLEQFQTRWGGNLSIQRTTHGQKFNWQLSADKAIAFLEAIQPALILKRSQADLAIAWWAKRPKQIRDARGRYIAIDHPDDAAVCEQMKALKKPKVTP